MKRNYLTQIAAVLPKQQNISKGQVSMEKESKHSPRFSAVISTLFILSNIILGMHSAIAFTHPGIYFQQADLDRMRYEVNAGNEPWKSSYVTLINDPHASSTWAAQPQSTMTLYNGQSGGRIDDDALAAFYNAVVWYITGNNANLQASKKIIDAWSSTLSNVSVSGPYGLAVAYAAQYFSNAGEILTYERGSGFSASEQAALKNMMENHFISNLSPPFMSFNHGTNQLSGLISLAIYCNDTAKYNEVITAYKAPGSYLNFPNNTNSSLATDVIADYGGQNAESYRDGLHPAFGLAALADTALAAYNSSGDSSLFTDQGNLLLLGSEYVAKWDAGYYVDFIPYYDSLNGLERRSWGTYKRGINATLRADMLYAQYTRLNVPCPWVSYYGQLLRDSQHPVDTLFFTVNPPPPATFPGGNPGQGKGGGSIANGTYKIINRWSGYCMEVSGGNTSNGSVLDEYPYLSGSNEQWIVSSVGNGSYTFKGVASGRLIEDSNSSVSGTQLDIQDNNGSAAEDWVLTPTSNGYFEITNAYSGQIVLSAANKGSGSWVYEQSGTIYDGFDQQWALVPTSAMVNRALDNGISTASSDYPPDESAAKAFDGCADTKWFTKRSGSSAWLCHQFGNHSWAITQYQLTSSDDMPQRDPKSWQLQGSNDGTNWTTLDTQTNQYFSSRGQTLTYNISNTTSYLYYRLNITANAGGSGYGIQLADLALNTL